MNFQEEPAKESNNIMPAPHLTKKFYANDCQPALANLLDGPTYNPGSHTVKQNEVYCQSA
uniref:Uncharacterized protein n=1 Tax=Rhizophora mucronata TaxID=61149 RepID=A0A2P2PCF2_RHIMU